MKRTSYSRFLARAAVTLLAVFCFLGARAQTTVTIGEGTATSYTNPIGTYYNYSIAEQLYTAEEIGMAGTISSISFYYMGIAAKDLPITVYMKHVDEADLSSAGITLADAEEVFSGTLSVTTTAGWVTITLDNPFDYDGTSNLLIGINKDYLYYFSGQSWQGTATTSAMARYTQNDYNAYDTSTVPGTAQTNRPNIQMVITPASGCASPSLTAGDLTPFAFSFNIEGGSGSYNIELKAGDAGWVPYDEEVVGTTVNLTGLTPETAYQVRVQSICEETDPETGDNLLSGWRTLSFTTPVACPVPTDVTVSDITPHTAVVSWTSDAGNFNLMLGETVFENVTSPYTLTSLPSETDYTVKVQAICGGENGSSQWTSGTSFTTPVACPAPTNLAFTDITAYSANVSWDGEADSYEMEYTTGGAGGSITYDFEDGTLQGWTNLIVNAEGGEWVHSNNQPHGYDYTTHAHSGTGFAMCYSFIDNDGAYDTNAYLVSPTSYSLGTSASLNFWYDMANDTYPEYFEVCVATVANPTAADFTPIWTLSTKGNKGNNVLRQATQTRQRNTKFGNWREVTIDLSAYVGQTIWIAFYDVNNDMYEVWIDDITVNTGAEATWTPVETVTNPYSFENLEPETTYVVRVRANCGGEGYSTWLQGLFTTLPTCMAPTNLVVSNVDKRSADLAWTPNGEEDAWQICINGDEENLIEVSETTYSFTDLEPLTNYTVKVRAKCSEENQSAWSAPATFTTLVACPAPTNLAISDIANVSAVASWVSDGDVELQYAENVWKQYDNGVYATTMGAGGTIYWGIMLPAASLTASEPLTKVALHTTYSGEATLNVYLGGDQPTGTPAATQTFTMAGDGDFMEIALDTPVEIDGTQNLWITFYQSGLTYPADGCSGPTDPNGRWVSLDGEEWRDIASYGYDYTWMIRAGFGDTEMEWVTVDNATSPQEITGLTPETNYFVRVKHICGGIDGESDWVTTNFTTDVACATPTALTATPYAYSAKLSWQGTSDSYTVRYGYDAVDEAIFTEDFAEGIPADWTNTSEYPWTVVDGYIQSGNAGVNSSTSTISFTMNVSTDAYFEFDAKCMGEGTSTVWDKCIFSIDGTAKFTKGQNGDQWDHYSFPVTAGEHTFTWSYSKDGSVNPTGDYMAVDNIAIVTVHTVWSTVDTDANECVITGLNPLTSYHVQVMGHCGDEYGTSEWSEMISFTTTDNACPTPTNLVADNITATTADISWNGSPDVESFTVRYRSPEHVVGGLSETFDNNSVPAGWTRYADLVDDVVAGTATLSTTSSGWNFGNTNVFGESHARINIWGTSAKYWLVTPEVTPASGSFTFDLALTDYSNEDPIEDPTAQADDRFVVLVYANDAWTILREWNNSGSEYVYNAIATEGEAVSIDLSAYVGQTVKIAFYGESTESNGDNDLHIDNVVIGAAETIPATEWQTVSTTETNVTLTGLTPETTYEVQVKSDCSDPEEWSAVTTFTTPEMPSIELANDDSEMDDENKNSAIIAAYAGKHVNVTLTGRTLYKDGKWNTICLPFDVDLNGTLAGATAMELTGAELDNNTVTLNFTGVGTLSAGVPYIIKWNSGDDIEDPVFSDVQIDDNIENQTVSYLEDDKVKFVGYYDAFNITADDDYIYYMTAGTEENSSVLRFTNKNRTLMACRAYFDFSALIAGARNFILNFGGEASGIASVEKEELDNNWYTVDGKKLDQKPTRKGVYIQNGRKVVIK